MDTTTTTLTLTAPPDILARIARTLAEAASADPMKRHLMGAQIVADAESITLSATDSYLAVEITIPQRTDLIGWTDATCPVPVWIAPEIIDALAKFATAAHKGKRPSMSITIAEDGTTMTDGTSTTTVPDGINTAVAFPPLAQVFPSVGIAETPARFAAEKLATIAKLAGTLAGLTTKTRETAHVTVETIQERKPALFTTATADGLTARLILMPQRA